MDIPATHPPVTGVLFTHNPFVWDPRMRPDAGAVLLRLGSALGPGERDYARLVALDAPSRRLETDAAERLLSSQKLVRLPGGVSSVYASDFIRDNRGAWQSLAVSEAPADDDAGPARRYVSFDRLVAGSDLIPQLQCLCRSLPAGGVPVTARIEVFVSAGGNCRVVVTGCDPMPEITMPTGDPWILSLGAMIGLSRRVRVDRLVWVEPSTYSALGDRDRHEVARTLGRVMAASRGQAVLVAGPGRWGTTTPSLGVPAGFEEIDGAVGVVELAMMHDRLRPEVSLGAHFLNDLVASGMLYFAWEPGRDGHRLRPDPWAGRGNGLVRLVPSAARLEPVVKVVDFPTGAPALLCADAVSRRVWFGSQHGE